MMMINGEMCDSLPLSDRALHYGDGLFETVAVVNGKPRLWSAHMQRLERGCKVLGLPQPDQEMLRQEALSLCGSEQRAVIKLIYSRGSGGRGYRPPREVSTRRIFFRYPWPEQAPLSEGVRIRLCQTPLACHPQLAGIKHLNRLEQVLARNEWDDPDIYEGLMCDLQGHVKEGTMCNLFWLEKGKLYTPNLTQCGVAGVMRRQVMELALEQGIQVMQSEITPDALAKVDEIFLTNSLIGICPVSNFDEKPLPSQMTTRRLRDALEQKLESMG